MVHFYKKLKEQNIRLNEILFSTSWVVIFSIAITFLLTNGTNIRKILMSTLLFIFSSLFFILSLKTKNLLEIAKNKVIDDELIQQSENIKNIKNTSGNILYVTRSGFAIEDAVNQILESDKSIKYKWPGWKVLILYIIFIVITIIFNPIILPLFDKNIKHTSNLNNINIKYEALKNTLYIANTRELVFYVNKYKVGSIRKAYKYDLSLINSYKITGMKFIEIKDYSQREGLYLYLISFTPITKHNMLPNSSIYIFEDTIAPDLPSYMKIEKDKKGDIILSWNHSLSNDVKGYNIYKNESMYNVKMNKNLIIPNKSEKYLTYQIGKVKKGVKVQYYLEVVDNWNNKTKLVPFK